MDDERRTKLKLSQDARRHWEETEASASSCDNPGGSHPTAPRPSNTAGTVPEVMIGTASRASRASCTRRSSSSVRPMAWPMLWATTWAKNVVADVATTITTAVQWATLSGEGAKRAASTKILP
jgi:hypothetical protein